MSKLPELEDYPEKRLHDMQVSAYSEDVVHVKHLISEYTKINALNAHVRALTEQGNETAKEQDAHIKSCARDHLRISALEKRVAELEGRMGVHGCDVAGEEAARLFSAEAERSCETCGTPCDTRDIDDLSKHYCKHWTAKPVPAPPTPPPSKERETRLLPGATVYLPVIIEGAASPKPFVHVRHSNKYCTLYGMVDPADLIEPHQLVKNGDVVDALKDAKRKTDRLERAEGLLRGIIRMSSMKLHFPTTVEEITAFLNHKEADRG